MTALPAIDLVFLAAVLSLAVILVAPGWVALKLVRHPAGGIERLAMAVGVSASLWPVALLWSRVAGVRWTESGLRLAMVVLLITAIPYRRIRKRADPRAWSRVRGRLHLGIGHGSETVRPPRAHSALAALALALVLGMAIVLRIAHVRGLVASPWVDGYHHTLITSLMLEHGGIPPGFRPYLPVDRFYYHFGFHSIAAALSWLSGLTPRLSVLWTGQALSALAALTVYALARRCLRHPVAAVAAAAVPATMYWFPSYFASWGRFTQLTGLVVLPIAWMLLADAATAQSGAGRARLAVLAGAVAGGLLLVHYRVFAFFVLGACVLAVGSWLDAGGRRRRSTAMLGAGTAAFLVVGPWLLGDLADGVRALSATQAGWFSGQAGVEDVPEWLFTTGLNGLLLALSVHGVVLGLARRARAAAALVVVGALAVASVDPAWMGLPSSWTLPPFSLAISAFLPVAIGIGFLADAAVDLVSPFAGRAMAGRGVAIAVVLAALYGGSVTREVVNPATVILSEADLEAADWIAANTDPDVRFLVSTAHWHLGTYRGLDGGYWLPLLARRQVTMPASFYNYGDAPYAIETTQIAERASAGDAMSDDALAALMHDTGADYVYVGPAADGKAGKLTPHRLRSHPRLEEVYDRDGVHVFRLRSAE